MAAKIALVDDETTITMTVKIALEEEGYTVVDFNDSEQALERILSGEFDAALLDIKMPRLDGMEMLSRIRKVNSMPIIMLTSKDHEVDEMLSLHMGADDYIKKPFSIRLIIARLRACLRRYNVTAQDNGSETDDTEIINAGDLVLDTSRHSCLFHNHPVNLTVTEFLLLRSLAERPGHVRSRAQLMDAAYGDNIHVEDRTVDSHIKRIRRKLRQVKDDFDQLETLYGVGYRYKG